MDERCRAGKVDRFETWKNHPCILKVDLEDPEKLQNHQIDYPLAQERILKGKVEKLIPNLSN